MQGPQMHKDFEQCECPEGNIDILYISYMLSAHHIVHIKSGNITLFIVQEHSA